jgi:hypothetical protein
MYNYNKIGHNIINSKQLHNCNVNSGKKLL